MYSNINPSLEEILQNRTKNITITLSNGDKKTINNIQIVPMAQPVPMVPMAQPVPMVPMAQPVQSQHLQQQHLQQHSQHLQSQQQAQQQSQQHQHRLQQQSHQTLLHVTGVNIEILGTGNRTKNQKWSTFEFSNNTSCKIYYEINEWDGIEKGSLNDYNMNDEQKKAILKYYRDHPNNKDDTIALWCSCKWLNRDELKKLQNMFGETTYHYDWNSMNVFVRCKIDEHHYILRKLNTVHGTNVRVETTNCDVESTSSNTIILNNKVSNKKPELSNDKNPHNVTDIQPVTAKQLKCLAQPVC